MEFKINTTTRLNDDYSEKESQIRNNRKIRNYSENLVNSNSRKDYINSVENVGVYQNNNNLSDFIDIESSLRNGDHGNNISNSPNKKDNLLNTSSFYNNPNKSAGKTRIINYNESNELIPKLLTKKDHTLRGNDIYNRNVIPLQEHIRDNVQNVNHIIPEYWVRGGLNTKNIVRNINYERECGKQSIHNH